MGTEHEKTQARSPQEHLTVLSFVFIAFSTVAGRQKWTQLMLEMAGTVVADGCIGPALKRACVETWMIGKTMNLALQFLVH